MNKSGKCDIDYTFGKEKYHIIPIYGLYADYDNVIVIRSEGRTNTINIKTDSLPDDFGEILYNENYSFYNGNYPYAVDINNDVRWYLNNNYYGNITTLTITEADVELLTTKTWKNYHPNSKSVSALINATDSEYWIYAYPAAWGSLTTISNNDGDWMAAFTSSTVNITGAPGLAISYKYYITVNKGAFKSKTINFS